MQESIKNVIKDGIVLLTASVILALGTEGFFSLFKNKALDGNPLVSSVAKAAASDLSKKENAEKRKEKIEKGEKVKELDQRSIEKLARREAQIREQLNDNMNPAKNDNIDYLHFRDVNGCTALMMVCYVNYNKSETTLKEDGVRLPYVELLIQRGSDIHAVDKHGWTAMCWAAWSGLPSIVDMFLNEGCEVDIKDYKGNTPLMMAAVRGNVETVEALLKKGANRDLKCSSGKTALDYATREYERLIRPSMVVVEKSQKEQKDINIGRLAKTVELLGGSVEGIK